MHPKHLRIADYTYDLPEERIAQHPLPERDASRLLIYESGNVGEDIYRNIADHLSAGSLLVFNRTRVVQVRLLFYKSSGAKIELFCLEPDSRYADIQTAMSHKSEVYWYCLVGGANKWKDNQELELYDAEHNLRLRACCVQRGQGQFLVHFFWSDHSFNFAEILHVFGKVPLPPYMRRQDMALDKERYQTIFAEEEGSVAAPTAGLHFTGYIFDRCVEKTIISDFLTLHVGAGTFKQVKSDTLEEHEMHAEWIDVGLDFLKRLSTHQGAVVPVGTTSMRTLESLYWIGVKLLLQVPVDWEGNLVGQWDPYELPSGIGRDEALVALVDYLEGKNMNRLLGKTQIMIAPAYKPRICHQLVTNFHQPNSTLLLLVAALIGDDWRKIYDYALQSDFRFLSYGDGCLLRFS